MDSEDATYYIDKIPDLEKEQTDFFFLSKEEVTVVKIDVKIYKYDITRCI
jgi:hypothetical protein